MRLVGAILANTTMAAGDTAEEIDKLQARRRRPHPGLARRQLLAVAHAARPDEFRLDLYPYVAGEGTRLFDDVPWSYRLDLISRTAFSNGTVGLRYRQHR